MSSFAQEMRVAARQLAGRPGFSLIVVITLAFGIGGTTTCFALLNAVAFKPIPFADPGRLVGISVVDRRGAGKSRLQLDAFEALEQTRGIFSSVIAYGTRPATVAGPGVAERVQVADVSGDVFSLLGVQVQRGRPLDAADIGTRVVVISDDLWARRLRSRADAVGMTLSLDGDTYVVVGVAGRGFSFPQDSRVWVPLDRTLGTRPVEIVARLEPGVSAAQADATLSTLSAGAAAGPAGSSERAAVTIPLHRVMIGTKQRDMALFVLAAAGLVLLVACANLAGLLAAQIDARRYEMALRAAIGADRLRLVRQLMTESAILAVGGGTLGLILAQWGVDLLSSTLGKPQGADWIAFAIDGRVVTFAMAAAILTSLLFGLAPAIGGTRVDLRGVLQSGDSGISRPGPRPRRTRGVLVAGQLAVSIALVSGAASIVTSSMRFDDIDPGFDRGGIVALRVALAGPGYGQPEQRFAFVDAAARRLRSLPGVASVAAVSHLPLIDRDVPYTSFLVDEAAPTERTPFASVRFADAGYIAAMGIPIRRGRAFTAAEARAVRERAAVINETMARRYWPDRDPIGSRLRLTGNAETQGWYTVVGIAGDVSQRQLPATPENQLYLPLAPAREVSLMVRTASDPAVLATQARDAVQDIDRSLAMSTNTMKATYAWYARDRRLQGLVIGTLGTIAMLLAGLGVFGVMSLMVSARTREIAIRLALGSPANAVLRLVLARGLTLASAGMAVGLLLASGLTLFLASIFAGVRAFDVSVLGAAVFVLGAVTLLSCWWPARRAMRVDPMVTLKQ
jgi:putative ABC transport system permease protein